MLSACLESFAGRILAAPSPSSPLPLPPKRKPPFLNCKICSSWIFYLTPKLYLRTNYRILQINKRIPVTNLFLGLSKHLKIGKKCHQHSKHTYASAILSLATELIQHIFTALQSSPSANKIIDHLASSPGVLIAAAIICFSVDVLAKK